MHVRVYSSLEDLPAGYGNLFAACAERSFFQSLPWFRCLLSTSANPGDEIRLYGLESDDAERTPLALYVMRVPASPKEFPGTRVLAGFENFYTIESGPLVSPSVSDPGRILETLISAMAAEKPAWNAFSMKMLETGSPVFEDLQRALRSAGLIVHPYFQYAIWSEKTRGVSYKDYIMNRGKSIKQTLARKDRKLQSSGSMEVRMTTDENGLEEAIDAYQRVYAESWKGSELYSDFMPALIRTCAQERCLRLGNLYLDGVPVATRFAISAAGSGILYKSAYSQDIPQNLSVGGVLTLHVLKHLLDVDHVEKIDLGIGDEPYKAHWVSNRGERWGLMAFNPRTLRGSIAAFRHRGGARLKAAWRAVRKPSEGREKSTRS